MESEAARKRTEIPVACDVSVLTPAQQERLEALYRELWADVKEARKLADGYAFRHSADRTVLLAIAEYVDYGRLCCPFLDFELTVERGGGPVWLRMTGEGE